MEFLENLIYKYDITLRKILWGVVIILFLIVGYTLLKKKLKNNWEDTKELFENMRPQ